MKIPTIDDVKKQTPDSCELPLFIGRLHNDAVVINDLAQLPHLLIAGDNGTDKSAFINSIICGLIRQCPPKKVRFLFADAKCDEYAKYNGLAHLAMPVITLKTFVAAMRWLENELYRRLKIFSQALRRNIVDYNASGIGYIPHLVVVVDELADFMVDEEELLPIISRIGAMGRSVGIHMILSTRYPDRMPGMIKANIPGRIAFKVSSENDSQLILGESGAENLINRGEMLCRFNQDEIIHVQSGIVSDGEIAALVNKTRGEYGEFPFLIGEK